MTASGPKPLSALGFLTVQHYAELGFIGGYLILNATGRPLEFHCTAPVQPSRAQEILYGPTLAPYLYGEQIGQTLISKGKSQPLFVCTDAEPVLAARDFSSLPVVWIGDVAQPQDPPSQLRIDGAHDNPPRAKAPRLLPFELGECRAAVAENHAADRDHVLRLWQQQDADVDLREPFMRLHEAISEAQRGAGRA